MRAPVSVGPHVRNFAKKAAGAKDPILYYLDCAPIDCLSDGDCFRAIERRIKECGGNIVFGWAIWEWPKVLIEAEFHAVWKAPDGSLHDITPRTENIPRILFVEDFLKTYQGRQVDNVRKPLSNDRDAHQFVAIHDEIGRINDRADFKDNGGAFLEGYMEPIDVERIAELESDAAAIFTKLIDRYGPPPGIGAH